MDTFIKVEIRMMCPERETIRMKIVKDFDKKYKVQRINIKINKKCKAN